MHQDDDLVQSELTSVTLCHSSRVWVSIWLIPINASSMASFSMPLAHQAHQARCKWQATEDPEYEIKTQEAIDGLHSGGFKSIWAAATALSRKLMCILQHTAITRIFLVEYLIECLTCCLLKRTGFIVVSILMRSLKLLSLGVTRWDWPKRNSIRHVCHSFLHAITSPTSSSLCVFNSWSHGKSTRTIFSHPSWQWVPLCSIVDWLSRSGAKLIFRINRKAQ